MKSPKSLWSKKASTAPGAVPQEEASEHPEGQDPSAMGMQFKVTVDVNLGGSGAESAKASTEVEAPENAKPQDIASKVTEAVIGAVSKAVKDFSSLVGGDKPQPLPAGEQPENPVVQPGTPEVPPAPAGPSTEDPKPAPGSEPQAPAGGGAQTPAPAEGGQGSQPGAGSPSVPAPGAPPAKPSTPAPASKPAASQK